MRQKLLVTALLPLACVAGAQAQEEAEAPAKALLVYDCSIEDSFLERLRKPEQKMQIIASQCVLGGLSSHGDSGITVEPGDYVEYCTTSINEYSQPVKGFSLQGGLANKVTLQQPRYYQGKTFKLVGSGWEQYINEGERVQMLAAPDSAYDEDEETPVLASRNDEDGLVFSFPILPANEKISICYVYGVE